MLGPHVRRSVASLLLLVLSAVGGCVSVSTEQAETEDLMWEAAGECKQRFLTIHSVDHIDRYGRLLFKHVGSGHENAAFLSCYQQAAEDKIRKSGSVPAERVVLDDATARQIVVRGQMIGRTLVVPARLNGTTDARLLVDTGSAWTVLSPRIASQLELPISVNTRRSVMVVAGGREVPVPRVRLASVKLGSAAVENLFIGVYDVFPARPQIHGVLGMDFLRHFRVSIDQRQPRLVLSPLTE